MATGVTVRVAGVAVKGISDYSVSEESTPVDPTDTTGATGHFTFSYLSKAATAAKRMRRKTVDLEDKGQGVTQGIARTPTSSGGLITLSVDLRTNLLAVQRTAQPYNGTLGGYFTYLLSLVGITTGFVIDTTLNSVPVTFPGWQGDVWLMMKGLAAMYAAEVSLASDNIVFRPQRGRITVDSRDASYDWSVDDSQLAQSVQGYYYSNAFVSNGLAYPQGGWNKDVQVYQVDAGETQVFDIPLDSPGVSLSSVQQPTAQDFVGQFDNSASAYCITSTVDSLPVLAAEWLANGGSITVAINDDTQSLTVTIVGANIAAKAPFTISASAGSSSNYSSLRILGTGVFFSKTLLTLPTSVAADVASQKVGAVLDLPFVTTLAQLYDRLIWTQSRYGGNRQQLAVKTTGINRKGDTGSYAYPTLAQFDTAEIAAGHTTIALFDTANSGLTIAQFNAAQLATVQGTFANQAFGNVAGARTRRDGLWWRIRQAQLGVAAPQVSYVGEADTTTGDFDSSWTGKLISDFNTSRSGLTADDFNAAPLEGAPF
jgi:hypothetical protein